jgi:hypothetical protein
MTTTVEGEGRGNGTVFCRKTLPGRVVVVSLVNVPSLLSSLVNQRAMGGRYLD